MINHRSDLAAARRAPLKALSSWNLHHLNKSACSIVINLVCMSQDRQVGEMLAYGSRARIIDQSQAVVVCAASFAWSRMSVRGRLARPSVGDSIGMAPSD
jgi:hypothetical protein